MILGIRPTYAWNAGGHAIVGYIAYKHLTPASKQFVDSLLQISLPPTEITDTSKDFVSATIWADEVRGQSGYAQTGPWHYIDNPFGILPETILPKNLPEPENIVTALQREVNILKSHTTKRTEKAEALRFIIHLVGDIHQPLHCVTRVSPLNPDGDRGGNSYTIAESGPFHSDNLHSYWDCGLGTFPDKNANIAVLATQIQHEFPDSLGDWKKGEVTNITHWMEESEWFAQHVVYNKIHRGKKVDASYTRIGTRIAHQRVAWAGYRLAYLLNTICKDIGDK